MPPANKPIKFLLVDDLGANLLALAGLLQREGLELYQARSGPEALELLLVHDFALAFLDVQMPGMDGFELAQLMRGTERTRHVPIIFLTAGSADVGRRFQGYEAGAVDFLFKPIEPHILKSKADIFFDLARERENLRTANEELTHRVAELREARKAALAGMEEAVQARHAAEALRQEAEAATRAKDEFLGALSHELRTPLNPALLLTSSLMADPQLSTDVRRDLQTIANGIGIQMRLVDDLLDITRIAGGKLRLDLRPVDVHAALRQTISMVEGENRDTRVPIHLHADAASPWVLADPVRLQQIFWNLLKNAVKFSTAGDAVEVRTALTSGPSDSLTVEVSDRGVGIASGMLERIFEPFIQEPMEGVHRSGGLGLGLAITRKLVDMMGGSIAAQSPGRGLGSTFVLTLPVTVPPPAAGSGGETPGALTAGADGRRILLVEDHADSRSSIKRLLERRGHTVMEAATAKEALRIAAEWRCDLVISDLGLPDGSGNALMAQLREGFGVPGIAVSGYGTPDDVTRSRDSGFFAHLTKPVDILTLAQTVAAAPRAPEGGGTQ